MAWSDLQFGEWIRGLTGQAIPAQPDGQQQLGQLGYEQFLKYYENMYCENMQREMQSAKKQNKTLDDVVDDVVKELST